MRHHTFCTLKLLLLADNLECFSKQKCAGHATSITLIQFVGGSSHSEMPREKDREREGAGEGDSKSVGGEGGKKECKSKC